MLGLGYLQQLSDERKTLKRISLYTGLNASVARAKYPRYMVFQRTDIFARTEDISSISLNRLTTSLALGLSTAGNIQLTHARLGYEDGQAL